MGLILLICCHCRSQKFEDPAEGEAALVAKFQKLHEDLTNGFRNLEDETRWLMIEDLVVCSNIVLFPIVRRSLASQGCNVPSVLIFDCSIHSYHIYFLSWCWFGFWSSLMCSYNHVFQSSSVCLLKIRNETCSFNMYLGE